MAHRAYSIIGKIYWVFRLLFCRFLDYVFEFIYRGKHEQLPPIKNRILLESATSLAQKIRTQQITSVYVVKAYLDRIREVNIIINALVEQRFAEAILEAQNADELVSSGKMSIEQLSQELPFLGVPFTTKECMNVKGLRQTGGLLARKNYVSDFTAPVIQQMIDAGAILLGVCNTSELISWAESHNHLYGLSKNSYDTTRTPGGSSGGDGTLISACGGLFSIGTDIGGSIRIPSFSNGIFGHKPTKECVKLDGMLPPNDGDIGLYNTIGPMCRYASDLIPAFKVLLKSTEVADKLKLDEPVDLRDLTIYYVEDFSHPYVSAPESEILNTISKAIVHLEKIYGLKTVKTQISEFKHVNKIYGSKIKSAATGSFSALLANGKGEKNGILELIKAMFFCSDHTLAAIFLSIYEHIFNSDEEFVREMNGKYDSLRKQLTDVLGENGVLFFPTVPRAAAYHHQWLLYIIDFTYTSMFSLLGFPSTHVPMGLNSQGLPIGFQVVGNYHNDRKTIAVARELEKVFGGWVPPCSLSC